MNTESRNLPHLLGNMKSSQQWLHDKITMLQRYLRQPMHFNDKGDNGLEEAMETRAKIMHALKVTKKTIDGLETEQAELSNADYISYDWMIAALRLQLKGYHIHLQALDQMGDIWSNHDISGVYRVINMIITALELISEGQTQMISGLELITREPLSDLVN